MTQVQRAEQAVEELSPDELAEFRRWFETYDAARWDRQLEEDVVAGRLDALAEEALREHARGETREL